MLQWLQVNDVSFVEAELSPILRAVVPHSYNILGVLGVGGAGTAHARMHMHSWKCMHTHGNASTPMEMHAHLWKCVHAHAQGPQTPVEPPQGANPTKPHRSQTMSHEQTVPYCPPHPQDVSPTFLSSVMN